MSLVDGRCEGSVHSHITKAECCWSAVGVAWGSPCEKCPDAEQVVAVVGPTVSPSVAPGNHLHRVLVQITNRKSCVGQSL